MNEASPLPPDVLEMLRQVDTPTVCNVIELFDVRPRTSGYMDQRIKAHFPEMPPMVGYATTATYRSSAPPQGSDVYDAMQKQLSVLQMRSGPHVIVFQDLDDPSTAATFGEVMCTSYQTFGAVGLITSGTGRDLDQVRQIGFPVFSSGTNCSHGYCHTLHVDVPVHVGGLTVRPGDLLHGDANGVTNIPGEIAADVARLCPEFVAAEEVVLECLRTHGPDLSRLQEARRECRSRIAQLTERLTG